MNKQGGGGMNDDIREWHWMYHHDHGVPDGWLVQSTIAFTTRIGWFGDNEDDDDPQTD
jgi:hypothetical protein